MSGEININGNSNVQSTSTNKKEETTKAYSYQEFSASLFDDPKLKTTAEAEKTAKNIFDQAAESDGDGDDSTFTATESKFYKVVDEAANIIVNLKSTVMQYFLQNRKDFNHISLAQVKDNLGINQMDTSYEDDYKDDGIINGSTGNNTLSSEELEFIKKSKKE